MTRVKRGTIANKKRKAVLKQTKGFRWGRKTKERAAKEALLHALSNAFAGRKQKKRDYRSLWQTKINAAARANETTYSKLISGLKKAEVKIDRKILADIAKNHPTIFSQITAKVK